jgi:hypothetical protein
LTQRARLADILGAASMPVFPAIAIVLSGLALCRVRAPQVRHALIAILVYEEDRAREGGGLDQHEIQPLPRFTAAKP